MASSNIKVRIRDTDAIVYEGLVHRISSYNEIGPFDIYPMHANFISIINREVSLYVQNKKIKEIKIDQAVLKVKRDVVSIYLGIEALLIREEKEMQSSVLKD